METNEYQFPDLPKPPEPMRIAATGVYVARELQDGWHIVILQGATQEIVQQEAFITEQAADMVARARGLRKQQSGDRSLSTK